ncbi:MAG: pepsin/retropepsin-like aspartic protease family protein [Saprospiraceae bacterium]|nr:pepsin/retropepsin-like aspartic protease family protein [Saprospiraceae bacterium]
MKGMTLLLLVLAHYVLGQNSISLIQTPARNEQIEVRFYYSMVKMPIEIVNGMIFVKASMNSDTGNYMLDTGAPMLVINQKNVNEYNAVKASGVAGEFVISTTKVNRFRWGGVEHRRIEAALVDLSHFEASSQYSIAGLIGYEMLKGYELFIDYGQKQLALLDPNKNQLLQASVPNQIIAFVLQNHLPVVAVEIGGQTLHFALDTGAGANLIDEKYLNILPKESYRKGMGEELRGVDKNVRPVTATTIYNMQLGATDFNDMKFLFTDLSHLESTAGLKIDGILGFSFFQQIKCSINYPKQQLYIW